MSIVKTIEVKTLDNKEVINELYINGEKENSLVVLFPGGNYSCDKPLLYYARKIALELGNNVLCINYSKKVSKEDIGS